MKTSKRGRPPTGCPRWNPEKQLWEARVMLLNGQRRPVEMPGIAEHETQRAKAMAKTLAIRARAGGFVPEEALETVNEWFGRYYLAAEKGDVGRKNRGEPQVTALDRERRFENWIAPIIGVRPMAIIGPEELRAVVRKLDEQIRIRSRFYDAEPAADRKGRKPGLSAKAARNIWGECTAGFREAATSKIENLRVRTDDPTRGVQPPTTTGDRDMAALYPSELALLLAAPTEKVPTYRRVLYAVAGYSGLRVSELRGLTKESIDFEHEVINVRRQRKAGKGPATLTRTKTRAGRRQVPIEAALVPLLQILVEGTDDGEPLLRVPPPEDCAELLRQDLIAAGCDREELFADDGERQQFTFHGLRHTCLTHWAVAGKGQQWLAAAGHTDLATTMGYVDVAVMLSGTFGQPHAPLPPELLREAEPKLWRNYRNSKGKYAELLRPQRELKIKFSCPELSRAGARSTEKQAAPTTAARTEPAAILDNRQQAIPKLTGAEIEWTMARLTRRMATAPDEEIADLVAERKAMRTELEALRRAALPKNVVPFRNDGR